MLSGSGQVSPLKPVCIYKNVCLGMKIKISPMARDGNLKRESGMDGDKRYF